MGIVLGDNIDYKGKKPLDSRMLFDTIAEMKAYSENYLPDITLAFNKEDSKMYVFNRENEVDTTTGKWREFESGSENLSDLNDVVVRNLQQGDGIIYDEDTEKFVNVGLLDSDKVETQVDLVGTEDNNVYYSDADGSKSTGRGEFYSIKDIDIHEYVGKQWLTYTDNPTSHQARSVCFYNGGGRFISGWNNLGHGSEDTPLGGIIPEGAYYCNMSFRKTNNTQIPTIEMYIPVQSAQSLKQSIKVSYNQLTDKPYTSYAKKQELDNAEHILPTFNFQFDDNNSQDEHAVQIFDKYQLTCGFACVADNNFITNAQGATRYKKYQDKGYEIISHSIDTTTMNTDTATVAAIENKLRTSKRLLVNAGFKVRGWVTPSSTMNDKYIPSLSKFYDFSYTVYNGNMSSQVRCDRTQRLDKLSRINIESNTTADLKAAIDTTIENNGFLTFYCHSVRLDGGYTNNREGFEEVVAYLREKMDNLQCYVLTPSEAVDYYFHTRDNDLEHLSNLGDVEITNPQDGDIISYDENTEKFVNKPIFTKKMKGEFVVGNIFATGNQSSAGISLNRGIELKSGDVITRNGTFQFGVYRDSSTQQEIDDRDYQLLTGGYVTTYTIPADGTYYFTFANTPTSTKFTKLSYSIEDLLNLEDYSAFYEEVLTTPSPRKGKVVTFLGDSITRGTGTTEGERYCDYLNNMIGFRKCNVNGLGGSCVSVTGNNGILAFTERYQDIRYSDLIVIFGGTNDRSNNAPLGNISDNLGNPKVDTSYITAWRIMLGDLQLKFPAARIVVVPPLHRKLLHGVQVTDDNFNDLGYTLQDYVDATKLVAEEYSCPVIDLWSTMGITPRVNITDYFPDGLHPNAIGHMLMARVMEKALNNLNFDGTDTREHFQKIQMPTAKELELGKIYQYTGTTNANYTNGFFYKCVESQGVYSRENVKVQDVDLSSLDDVTITSPVTGQGIVYDAVTGKWINGKASDVLTFKGSVADYASLPASDQEVGDVWNCLDNNKNYVWTGTAWDEFSSSYTFSNVDVKNRWVKQLYALESGSINDFIVGDANGATTMKVKRGVGECVADFMTINLTGVGRGKYVTIKVKNNNVDRITDVMNYMEFGGCGNNNFDWSGFWWVLGSFDTIKREAVFVIDTDKEFQDITSVTPTRTWSNIIQFNTRRFYQAAQKKLQALSADFELSVYIQTKETKASNIVVADVADSAKDAGHAELAHMVGVKPLTGVNKESGWGAAKGPNTPTGIFSTTLIGGSKIRMNIASFTKDESTNQYYYVYSRPVKKYLNKGYKFFVRVNQTSPSVSGSSVAINEFHFSTQRDVWGSAVAMNHTITPSLATVRGMTSYVAEITPNQYTGSASEVYFQVAAFTTAAGTYSANTCDIEVFVTEPDYFLPYNTYSMVSKSEMDAAISAAADSYQNCITFWGDSLTAGGGWTTRLASLAGMTERNGGTGGENARTIVARQGADVMMINNKTIPASGAVTLYTRSGDVGIPTQEGYKVTPLLQGGSHVNPVKIGDITGTLAWTGSSYADQNGTWTFTRSTAGSEVTIDRPTAMTTNFDRTYNNPHLMVIFIGQNGGYSDLDDLVRQHRLMIDHAKAKHYIVLGLSSGSAEQRADYETRMKKEFGRYFISLREYLSTPIYENGNIVSCYGMADQNVAVDPEFTYDGKTTLQEIAAGICPHQILADSVHYTSGTKTVIGDYLYKKCKELGIF